jgi:hypothetical protein
MDDYADGCRLGRWLVESGFESGFDLLASKFREGDLSAGYHLARYLKRRGDFETASAIWSQMFERGKDIDAAFELAKYAEHKLRDLPLAEFYTLFILEGFGKSVTIKSPESREGIEHRLARIRRKKLRYNL